MNRRKNSYFVIWIITIFHLNIWHLSYSNVLFCFCHFGNRKKTTIFVFFPSLIFKSTLEKLFLFYSYVYITKNKYTLILHESYIYICENGKKMHSVTRKIFLILICWTCKTTHCIFDININNVTTVSQTHSRDSTNKLLCLWCLSK